MTADELRTLIQQLPPIEGADIWANHRRAIRQHILTESIDTFMEWSTISATMHVGNAPFMALEREAIPYSIELEDSNLIHQAYHLWQWERVTGRQVKKLNRVIEFGGGYGAMCHLSRLLGFKGQYVIMDLPEMNLLQQYYLGLDSVGYKDNTYLFSDLDRYYEISCRLFIASHSLSEIPIEQRHKILEGLDADSFLFVFHCQHNEVDNLEWFRQFIEDNLNYKWQQWYTPHLPNQWYQIGIKR